MPASVRILLVADMRSPHSLGWARGVLSLGASLRIISSRRLSSGERNALPAEVAALIVHEPRDLLSRLRIAVTQMPAVLRIARRVSRDSGGGPSSPGNRVRASRTEGASRWELPLELAIASMLRVVIRRAVREYRPDLVHALRVPFEGIAASGATAGTKFAVSTWGSDLVRQAASSSLLARSTRRTMSRVDAIHADCHRDTRLAREWGAPETVKSIVAPGNMGFDSRVFGRAEEGENIRHLVVFPRGVATVVDYVGSMVVASRIVAHYPHITCVGVRLAGEPQCEQIRRSCSDPERIVLTGRLTQAELAEFYKAALVVVSPSISDGTPNSVLEAMACGAIPVVGDISPLRELFGPELVDNLFDPSNVDAMRAAIESILSMTPEAARRMRTDFGAIAAWWSREANLPRVKEWYESLICPGIGTY